MKAFEEKGNVALPKRLLAPVDGGVVKQAAMPRTSLAKQFGAKRGMMEQMGVKEVSSTKSEAGVARLS